MRVLLIRSLVAKRLVATSLVLLAAACGGGEKGPTAPAPVASVVIAAGSSTVLVGQSQQLSASTIAASGATLTGRVVRWSSSNAAVGTISDAGLLLGVATGSTTISATSEGRSGSATLTILPVPVASVNVTPSAAVLLMGQTLQLSATARDSIGSVLSGRDITWSSNDASRATVSASGLVTTLTTGPVVISAASEGWSGSAAVSVLPVPVASVAITTPATLVPIGRTLQLSATMRDSVGGVLVGRAITWTSGDATKASVSGSGVLTALGVGTVSIVATSEGRSGSATITVTVSQAPVLSGISPVTLTPGQTATLTGIGFAESTGGNTITVRGTPATVVSASATQLTFVVPCVNGGPVSVQATTSLGVGVPLVAAVSVTSRPLDRGASLILTAADASACNELPSLAPGARYLVVVSSAATSANTQTDFLLAGNTPSPAATVVRLTASSARDASTGVASREPADAHFAHLERERALYASLQASGAFRERTARSIASAEIGRASCRERVCSTV